jgi:hypothetical protein
MAHFQKPGCRMEGRQKEIKRSESHPTSKMDRVARACEPSYLEAKTGRMGVQSQCRQKKKVCETPISTNKKSWDGGTHLSSQVCRK